MSFFNVKSFLLLIAIAVLPLFYSHEVKAVDTTQPIIGSLNDYYKDDYKEFERSMRESNAKNKKLLADWRKADTRALEKACLDKALEGMQRDQDRSRLNALERHRDLTTLNNLIKPVILETNSTISGKDLMKEIELYARLLKVEQDIAKLNEKIDLLLKELQELQAKAQ